MKKVVIALVGLSVLVNLFNILMPAFSIIDLQTFPTITGGGVTGTGSITLVLLSSMNVFIDSPENKTYDFNLTDDYFIDLNVSADFTVDTWWYTLKDLRHNTTVNDSVMFVPNTTIRAVRWSNKLIVFANDSTGSEANASVEFFIYVPNTAPFINYIDDEIFVCEGNSISYKFNATDLDEDDLSVDIDPKNPFFIYPPPERVNLTTVQATIFSGTLTKEYVGTYTENISVSDGQYADSKSGVNITVIEINNVPSVENIGVQTVWTHGENSTFYEEVDVSDTENGNQSTGNFTFNLTFLNGNKFFDINEYGIMNFTANDSLVGVYNISLCVTDSAISNIHPNISLCNQDGLNNTVCQNFSLTVTDENRNPTITSYYPGNLTLTVSGTESVYFNISKYDPDGTVPDTYWYVDGVLVQYNSGNLTDELTYTFGCGISGTYKVKAEITDGLLNDSVEWSVDVLFRECPKGTSGGGGGGTPTCIPNWVCENWQVCQNAKASLEAGVLSGEDYRFIKSYCDENKISEASCGMQIRKCFDLNSCNVKMGMPVKIQPCLFVKEASCSDGIRNCHQGSCELLVDCGGPCKPCPTCSDGIQNQGELGIDCGGPCPWKCPAEVPLSDKYKALLWIVLFILIILALIKTVRIIRLKTKLEEKK